MSTELDEHIVPLVRAGYMTAEEIVEAVAESMDDDGVDGSSIDLDALVRAKMTERRREIDEARAGGRPTAYDRLRDAFGHLEASGVLARENYWCCQTCAYAAIDEEVWQASDQGSPPRGYVLFHNQDTDRAVETGLLLLRYGGSTAEPEKEGAAASKRIGEELVAVLRARDFAPQWSGSPDDVVTLPIVWDRRPPDDVQAP